MHCTDKVVGCQHVSSGDKAIAARLQVETTSLQGFTLMHAALQGCRPCLRVQPQRGFWCLPPQPPSCAWPKAVAAAKIQPLLSQPLQVSACQAENKAGAGSHAGAAASCTAVATHLVIEQGWGRQ